MKRNTFRAYSFERDEKGMPTKMYWLGDIPLPERKTREQQDEERLIEHERTYGKRAE